MPKLIFFGTSDFAIPALEALIKNGMAPLLIVSTPDKSRGRRMNVLPSPVKKWALDHAITITTPATLKNPEVEELLKGYNPDLFIIAAYGKIIPKAILDIPKNGAINIHPSLLPKLRGASPIQYTILQNEDPGITIMLTDEEMDHGPIIKNEKLSAIDGSTPEADEPWAHASGGKMQNVKLTYKVLKKELAELGAKLLIETIPEWCAGNIRAQEQNHVQATYTKKITKEDGRINWQEPAELIERKVRAFNPWPGTYTFLDYRGKKIRLVITASEAKNITSDHSPGAIFLTAEKELAVACGTGSLLIRKIKPEGKKEIDAPSFHNGYKDIVGAILNS